MSGKPWDHSADRWDNTVRALSKGRMEFHDWASQEFSAWLLLQAEYYMETLRGLKNTRREVTDEYIIGVVNHCEKMMGCLSELISRVRNHWRRTDWNSIIAKLEIMTGAPDGITSSGPEGSLQRHDPNGPDDGGRDRGHTESGG